MPVPNLPTEVLVTDTFEQWRVKTNSIISAVSNDTILLNELPEIGENTVLGNITAGGGRPIAIGVSATNGIKLTNGALALVTPTGGITLTTTGALALATGVAGAGLTLSSTGVLSIPLTTTSTGATPTANSGLKFVTGSSSGGTQTYAGLGVSLLTNGGITLTNGALALVTPGGGITLTNGALALATSVAGAGLTLSSSGVLALAAGVAGAGLTLTSGALAINYNTNNFQISSSQLALSTAIANKVSRGTAFAWVSWNRAGVIIGETTSYNINSMTLESHNISFSFTTPASTVNYAVIVYSGNSTPSVLEIVGGLNSRQSGQIPLGTTNVTYKGLNGIALTSMRFVYNVPWDDGTFSSWLTPATTGFLDVNSLVIYA